MGRILAIYVTSILLFVGVFGSIVIAKETHPSVIIKSTWTFPKNPSIGEVYKFCVSLKNNGDDGKIWWKAIKDGVVIAEKEFDVDAGWRGGFWNEDIFIKSTRWKIEIGHFENNQKIQDNTAIYMLKEIKPVISVINISYGPHGEYNLLDIYYKEGLKNAPIIITVHGGAWISGDKSLCFPVIDFFTEYNCVVAAVNYRLIGDEIRFPAPVNDIASAMAWVKKHASEFGGDKDKVILHGGCAGAHLAALLTYDKETDWLIESEIQDETTDCIGFIGTNGIYDFDANPRNNNIPLIRKLLGVELYSPGKWDVAEPINFITSNSVPAVIAIGELDSFINQSLIFASSLQNAGVNVRLVVLEGEKHSAPHWKLPVLPELQNAYLSFLKEVALHDIEI